MSRQGVISILVVTAAYRRLAPAAVFAQAVGIREVSASARSIIPLQTRLRYTTMIVLPDDQEILDVICGDRDFWVISATHNIAHVKPAKEGAATNLNLVTASGAVYSFLLSEKNGARTRPEGLRQCGPGVHHPENRSTTAPPTRGSAGRSDGSARGCRSGAAERDRGNRNASTAIPGSACSSCTARSSMRSRSWCARSGTTASSRTSRRTRVNCRRSTRSRTGSRHW